MDNIKLKTPSGLAEVKFSQFPAGEEYVKIIDIDYINYNKVFHIEVLKADSKTIIQSIMLADAVKQIKPNSTIIGIFPYVPYGRQDRVCSEGESFSIKVFEEMIKLRFDKIQSYDMHSKVSIDLFEDIQIPKEWLSIKTGLTNELKVLIPKNYVSLAPDAGAIKRAEQNKVREIAVLDKVRKNGKIFQVLKPEYTEVVKNAKNIVIFDDICDGGGTFLGAVNVIREYNINAKIYLVISHGIFSKGTDILLDKFEDVIVINDGFNLNNLIYI